MEQNIKNKGHEMPRYKCHKEVGAVKIRDISEPNEGGGRIGTPWEEGQPLVYMTAEFIKKHNPQIGGYYVIYEDGYLSFSPAKAFEDGYTLIK